MDPSLYHNQRHPDFLLLAKAVQTLFNISKHDLLHPPNQARCYTNPRYYVIAILKQLGWSLHSLSLTFNRREQNLTQQLQQLESRITGPKADLEEQKKFIQLLRIYNRYKAQS